MDLQLPPLITAEILFSHGIPIVDAIVRSSPTKICIDNLEKNIMELNGRCSKSHTTFDYQRVKPKNGKKYHLVLSIVKIIYIMTIT